MRKGFPTVRPGYLLLPLLVTAELAALWHRDQVHRLVSGGATPLLEAVSILHHHNLLLRGWYVSSDAYLFTDLPFYVAGVAVSGMSAGVAHAVTWVVTVVNLTGFWAITRRMGGQLPAWASVAAWLGLSPLVLWLAGFGNIHVGTIGLGWWLFLGAASFIFPRDPAGAGRAWSGLAGAALLAFLVTLSDPYGWVAVLLPAVFATWLQGQEPPAWRRQVLSAVLLLSGLLSVPVRTWLDHHGLVFATLPAAFIPWPQVGTRLALTVANLWNLTGGWVLGRPLLAPDTLLRLGRLVLAAASVAGWYGFYHRPAGPARWLGNVLLAAAGASVLAATFSTIGGPVRYLLPWAWVEAAGLGLWAGHLRRRDWGREGWLALMAVGIVSLTLMEGWRQPVSSFTRSRVRLVRALTADRIPAVLTTDYEQGNNLTVLSGGHVRALVVAFRGGRLVPFNWEADVNWYRPAAGPVRALLFERHGTAGEQVAIRRQFGLPARELRLAGQTLWIWPANLIPRLGRPWFAVPGK